MTRIIDMRRAVTSKGRGQGYNVTSSFWRVFAHKSTTKSQKHQNWYEDCPCHGWHSASFPRSKGQNQQAALGSCSSRQLQGTGAFCGVRTTG